MQRSIYILSFFLFQVFYPVHLTAQDHNNVWLQQTHHSEGITFSTYLDGFPEPLDLPSDAQRARTVISDHNGMLAVYLGFDGFLYNHNHQLVLGSRNLKIHHRVSHASMLFPHPSEWGIYYLVHTTKVPPNLYYTKVDMREGTGRVEMENQLLARGVYGWSTQIANHHKDDHYWLLVHKADSDSILSFPVGPEGFTEPGTSTLLPAPSYTDVKGPYMTLTPDSETFAVRVYDKSVEPAVTYVLTGKFNKMTGRIERQTVIDTFTDGILIRSIALSPKGKKLYVNTSRGSRKSIDQYDLTARSAGEISLSRDTLIHQHRLYWGDFSMMPGPDGKIYFARARFENADTSLQSDNLGVINYPDRAGLDCKITAHPYALWGRLPNIPVTQMQPGFIHVTEPYDGYPTSITLENFIQEPRSVRFNIYSDGRLTGNLTNPNAKFTFPLPGLYRIEAVLDYGDRTRIMYQIVNIKLSADKDSVLE